MLNIENHKHAKLISFSLVFLLVLGVIYLSSKGVRKELFTSDDVGGIQSSQEVLFEESPINGGSISTPSGFPSEIPLEVENIVESNTTVYSNDQIKQLFVSYLSSKTLSQKYAEYKSFLEGEGYEIKEGNSAGQIKAIFGSRDGSNISTVISRSTDNKTLVQITYVLRQL